MITNLSKSFHFQNDEKEYAVEYMFKNDSIGNAVSLVLEICLNNEEKTMRTLSKPTATLYQSNEAIEKMIADEIISFSN